MISNAKFILCYSKQFVCVSLQMFVLLLTGLIWFAEAAEEELDLSVAESANPQYYGNGGGGYPFAQGGFGGPFGSRFPPLFGGFFRRLFNGGRYQ